MNWDKVDQLVIDKYISVQKHPTLDLWIYNYTQKCQFEKMWTEETMTCRGLITNTNETIVARPFKKFFNYAEYAEGNPELIGTLPVEEFEVYDKLDGSLGILYWDGETPCLATRGSFVSDQAKVGTQILQNIDNSRPGLVLDRTNTYLFEIIYPGNRIVVDYGDTNDIVLLAVIRTEDSNEMPYETMSALYGKYFRIVERFNGITDVAEIKKLATDNTEGVVIRYKSGMRVKVKWDEYVRLHRIVTGVNAKRIWEYLKDGKPLDELLERVPDEFYKWVRNISYVLQEKFNTLRFHVNSIYDLEYNPEFSRKEQAERFRMYPQLQGLLFKKLDGKPIDDMLWKMVKPEADRPFVEDPDA